MAATDAVAAAQSKLQMASHSSAGTTTKRTRQRRKMLRSSLKAMPGALDAAQTIGVNLERRAETLSVDEWISLARRLG